MKKNLVLTFAGVLIVAAAAGTWWWSGAKTRSASEAGAPTAGKGAAPNGGAVALVTLAAAQRQDVPVTV
jgi:multidrug efflux system membrane fusion protein